MPSKSTAFIKHVTPSTLDLSGCIGLPRRGLYQMTRTPRPRNDLQARHCLPSSRSAPSLSSVFCLHRRQRYALWRLGMTGVLLFGIVCIWSCSRTCSYVTYIDVVALRCRQPGARYLSLDRREGGGLAADANEWMEQRPQHDPSRRTERHGSARDSNPCTVSRITIPAPLALLA